MSYSSNCRDLDTNPNCRAVYDRVIICPECGYAASTPGQPIDDRVRTLVASEEYQAILNQEEYDDIYKKHLLAAYLSAELGDFGEAGYNYLVAYWYLKDQKSDDAPKVCQKAIENLEKHLETHVNFEEVLKMSDLLRQMGRFDEAMENLCALESFVASDKTLMAFVTFEKVLVSEKDSSPHKMREVKV